MIPSFYLILACLVIGIVLIVILTTRMKLHPFFALLLASIVVGCGVGLPVMDVLNTVKEGFGNIMRSLALIIVLGTALGIVLEKTGCTQVMASFLFRKLGKHPALAMSITGYIVGMPLFCDSGFIVLSGLNRSFAAKTGTPVVVMAIAMATGLYSVHCLIPPHPGAAAAATTIGVDFGRLILFGLLIALPVMFVGNLFARYRGKKFARTSDVELKTAETEIQGPAVIAAFLPVIVPVILIAVRSFLPTGLENPGLKILSVAGDPIAALSVGLLLAIATVKKIDRKSIAPWLQEAAEKAGGILVIIGMGGGFGAVLNATHIGQHFSTELPLTGMGLLFPFLLTALLKTAQGSSTVAIITAASIVQPLLVTLGFITPDQKLLSVLSMGAGSMMISHANDAYFWVISRFEKIDMKPMLQVYSVASVLMGITAFLFTCLLSMIL